jgi:gliding motility-associated-like protein
VTIPFTDNLVLSTNNDTLVCAGALVPMLATTNGTGGSFSWSPSSGLTSSTISNPTATVSANAVYTVTASLNGCIKTKNVSISIKPNPVISAGPDKTIVQGDEVMLEGNATNYSSFNWSPASTLTNANLMTPVAKPSATTTYTLTVKDFNNCTSTDDVLVTVIPYCLNPMNAFTPNGDGINDQWLASRGQGCTRQTAVAVYNRYGQAVYKNDNYNNDWDGKYNGKPVADGTYYYVITYHIINRPWPVTLHGNVTILR